MIKLSQLKRKSTVGTALFIMALAVPLFVNQGIASAEETVNSSEVTETEGSDATTMRSEYQKRLAERAEEIQKQAAERAKELESKATERARELQNSGDDNENGETVRKKTHRG